MKLGRIVLAYAGDLETSIGLRWLTENRRAEVVALTLDLGHGRELDAIRERALALGAARAHLLDVRDEFARSFVLPVLQAGALSEGLYPPTTALAHPLIAKHLIEIARIEGAGTVAHGGAGRGNHSRLERAIAALDPSVKVIAPIRELSLSRDELIEYAREQGIPVVIGDSGWSAAATLWGRTVASSDPDDAWQEPSEDLYALTRAAAEAPDMPAYVELEFVRGVPVAINGVAMPLVELVDSLQTISGAHGIGRSDRVVDNGAGVVREIVEAPAAVALHTAHRELQRFVTPRDVAHLTSELAVKYANLVETGEWYAPAREAIDTLVARLQTKMTGRIRLKLFKGACEVVGRQVPSIQAEAAAPCAGQRRRRGEPALKT